MRFLPLNTENPDVATWTKPASALETINDTALSLSIMDGGVIVNIPPNAGFLAGSSVAFLMVIVLMLMMLKSKG